MNRGAEICLGCLGECSGEIGKCFNVIGIWENAEVSDDDGVSDDRIWASMAAQGRVWVLVKNKG